MTPEEARRRVEDVGAPLLDATHSGWARAMNRPASRRPLDVRSTVDGVLGRAFDGCEVTEPLWRLYGYASLGDALADEDEGPEFLSEVRTVGGYWAGCAALAGADQVAAGIGAPADADEPTCAALAQAWEEAVRVRL